MFQSTRPAWGATRSEYSGTRDTGVSIHAPRVGRDTSSQSMPPPKGCFNPRAPRGARPDRGRQHCLRRCVSIHAPRVGRDRTNVRFVMPQSCFNPRAPRGARRSIRRRASRMTARCFNPRAPRGARLDITASGLSTAVDVSIHAPRVGRDHASGATLQPAICSFNPRAPRGARRIAVRNSAP